MKAIVTVLGKDQVGIIYNISKVMNELEVNIEDISQTILQDKFTMVMVVNINTSKSTLKSLQEALEKVGKEMNVSVRVQKEDIFDIMHKI